MSHLLSKSRYIRGLQCERALWLDAHCPSLARYTREQMHRFDVGREFEYAFKAQFENGIDISKELGRRVDDYPTLTSEMLRRSGEIVLFEAGFLCEDVLVLADVVVKRADGTLDIYEVKSGTALSDTYRNDAQIQYYVVSHCYDVNTFSIVYNDQGFKTVDLTADLQLSMAEVAANIKQMKSIVLTMEEPCTPTGVHCLQPYSCPYQHHCRQGTRQLALF
ncbi:MAG: hypothetical protein IJ761_07050 [Bacteroidales bacterium]|nr:hypothetical protein [Bacteroidales bacterium]